MGPKKVAGEPTQVIVTECREGRGERCEKRLGYGQGLEPARSTLDIPRILLFVLRAAGSYSNLSKP